MITKTPDTEWCHGEGPLTFSCRHTFSFDRTRNSRLGTLSDPIGWQVTSWSVRTKPTQEITSSVSPVDALILSHGTRKITDGNRERQGVLITKEGTSFTWLLGTFWAHIQPSVLCHSFPPWVCVASPLITWTALWHWQVIRDSKVQTCKQCLIILPGVYGNQKLQSSARTANKPFSSGLQGCAPVLLTSWLYWLRRVEPVLISYNSSNRKPCQTSSEVLNSPKKNLL